MTDKVFINYRRGDDSGFAQALFIRLEQVMTAGDLFMDVDSIAPGEDFVQHLDSQIALCDVLLAIIGKTWVDATDAQGRRRLDDPDDFVRIEIASALKQGKRVIPVLLHDTRMPSADQLPEEIRPLTRRQAVRLTHERFRADSEGLIKALQGAHAGASVETFPEPERKTVPAAVVLPAASPNAAARLSIAAKVEHAAARYEAINFGVISLISAFLLIFGSYMAGVVDVEYKAIHKQIGFVWAPNWSVNYLVLFVVYNSMFCLFVNFVDETLRIFTARRVVAGDAGTAVSHAELAADWRAHLSGISPILWVMNLGVPFIAAKQWFDDCYLPLHQNDMLGKAADWTVIAVLQPGTSSAAGEIAFTAVAYAYMAISLWIYLFVLAYAASFAWYLAKLSRGTGAYRLVFRTPYLPERLHHLLQRVFTFSFLGYLSAYFMRLEAYYLSTPISNIFQAMFSTEAGMLRQWTRAATAPAEYTVSMVTSAWTCWGVFLYAAVIFGVALSLLQSAYNNARDHALSADEVENTQVSVPNGFWGSVAPSLGHWIIVTLLMATSIVFPMTGSLFVFSLLCAIVPVACRWSKSTAAVV